MLIPKRTKYRKQHRPVRSGMSKGGGRTNHRRATNIDIFNGLF